MLRSTIIVLALALVPSLPQAQQRLGDLTVSAPWSRATPATAPVAAGYVEIRNNGSAPDRLIGATVAVAGRVEIHEMAVVDGVMRMRPLANGLTIPGGRTVTLAPGGYHLMLMELRRQLAQGDRLAGTLVFERAGQIEVEFEVGGIGTAGPPRVR
jgi:periplasmic copper chaperone A